VLRARLPGARIDSAGTAGWHMGNPPYGPAIAGGGQPRLRPDRSACAPGHVEDFNRFDLILAMDRQNLADLEALAPADTTAELRLFLDPLGGGDVPDPYYTRDFDGALDLIERAASAWAEQIG
jgi:protein-tyrosine phosphatase